MIECRNLTKEIGGRGVHGLTLKVSPGEALALAGPVGAGKSLTLKMLMGFTGPDGGSAEIAGLDCWRQRARAQRRAAFAQAAPSLDLNARGEDYLAFIRRYAGGYNPRKAAAFEERMGFTPVGLIRRMDLEGRKKLGLLAAFSLDRDALLLDEPFAGLSPLSRNALASVILDEAKAGRAVLLTAHVLEDARRAGTHVAVMRQGSLVVRQTAEEMSIVRPKVYHVTFSTANEAAAFAREWEAAVELIGSRALVAVPASPQALIRTLARYEVADLRGGAEEGEENFLRHHGDELA